MLSTNSVTRYNAPGKTELPHTDSQLERHQFYARIGCEVDKNCEDINGIGHKLNILISSYESVRDRVIASLTEIKTFKSAIQIFIGVAAFFITLISAGAGWYVNRTVNSVEKYVDRIEELEKKTTSYESDMGNNKETAATLAALKRMIADQQRRVDDLETRKK